MENRLRLAAEEYVENIFRHNAGGHDAAHTFRVRGLAMALAQAEPTCSRDIIELAALLHDADDPKLFPTEDLANARAFLSQNGVSPDTAEQICSVIRSVSFSRNQGRAPDTLEGMIVQDADRLDAMGAIGIARTFAYGGEHGRSLASSIQHFYDKLLKLKDLMNTPAAKKLAEERHAFLNAFLGELESELRNSG